MKKILYLSYNGMMEPLGASQVLSYLYKMSSEYDYYLISLEKPDDWCNKDKRERLRKEIEQHQIKWFPILYREDKIGKLFNWFRFTKHAYKVLKKNKIIFLHCRSYLPALSAYVIQKIRPVKYLFDTRGFAFDERADTGRLERKGFVFKMFKRLEKKLYIHASGVNKLSREGKRTILENELFKGGNSIKVPITVIPTCVDLDRFYFIDRTYQPKVKLGYVGTTVGWYDFDKTLELVKVIGSQMDYHFTIYNSRDHDYIKAKLDDYNIPKERVTLEKVAFSEMPEKLRVIDIVLFYIHPYFSKRASAATKLGELLASGIPVITNSGIGDHDFYITKHKAGKIIDFDHVQDYDFITIISELRTIETSNRCRELAEQYFSIDKGIEEYRKLYTQIFIQ